MHSGFVLWLTGLSGAGKSTLAVLVTEELARRGHRIELFDGDAMRKRLSPELGFSREDRDENVRRIASVAVAAERDGACAVVAAISPYRVARDLARAQAARFVEVYVECPLDVLTARDPKGLYKRALAGELRQFTGIDDPYESPAAPDVHVHTDREAPAECAARIIAYLAERSLIPTR